ncbi:MAG: hypothetical protein ACFFDW_06365 [Candidatus Thorarchaeota archaeon]
MNETGAFESFIRRTINCLDKIKANYCIVGAIAASYYGSVRSTEDLDIIIDLSFTDEETIKQLANCLLENKIDLIETDMVHGLREKSHITAFDTETYFYRIHFKGVCTAIDRETMEQKIQKIILNDLMVCLTPPELQIIAKLLPGMNSEKDILDIKNILISYKKDLNQLLLVELSQRFGVKQKLEEIFNELAL